MAQDFPRLLVATEFPPNASGGGPAVVRQMLKGWPVEKLFWWSCLPENGGRFGQKFAAHRVAAIPRKLYPHQRWCEQKSWLLENLWTPWAAGHLRRTLTEFRPDAVWVIPHQWSIPPMIRELSKMPFAYHVSMHDYMDAAGCVARFGVACSSRLAAAADRLYREASTRDAICQPMVEDLRARTGCSGLIARAGLEPEDFDFLEVRLKSPSDKIKIAYAGTILAEDAFTVFVSTVERIRRQLPFAVSLEFFGSHSYRQRSWFDASWMNEHGDLPLLQLSAALKECNWGFLPMALTNHDPRYNRFSLPTKFISYLSAGLPTIALGHPESSVVKMARTYHVGACLATDDPEIIGRELLDVLADSNAKTTFRAEIMRCAAAEFDAAKMRASLRECFRAGAEQNQARVR